MRRVCLTEAGRSVIRRLNTARLSGREQRQPPTPERRSLASALSRLLEREDVAGCRPEGVTP